MIIRAFPGPDGWIRELIAQDDAHPPILVDEVRMAAMPDVPPGLLFRRADGIGTPHDDRIAWRRLARLGLSGSVAATVARGRRLDFPDAIEAPTTVDLPARGFTAEYAEVPGLILRTITPEDLEYIANDAIATGVQPATCPEATPCCRPANAHAWLELASLLESQHETWQLMLEYRGQPMAVDVVELSTSGVSASYTAQFGTWPAWVWREYRRPIFERLVARQRASILIPVKATRLLLIAFMKNTLGAVEDSRDATTVYLRLTLGTALSRMTGWPDAATIQATFGTA